jgi:beta-lactamase superfamily II metal-dependent hydrolase
MSLVKSLSVGNGDMFYIKHNTDNFTIIDCCMPLLRQDSLLYELKLQSAGKNIIRFISTHPDDDHLKGLTALHERMNLLNFYCVRNATTKPDQTDDFDQYCALRDDTQKAFYIFRGCSRKWMNDGDEVRANSGLQILWPDTSNQLYQEALEQAAEGGCANNISAIVQYHLKDGPSILWMGDLETYFMEDLDPIPVGAADILFAPHHGRDSGRVPTTWLEKIKPKLIVVGEAPAEHLHYYPGYNTITQNSAGDITLDCDTGRADIFVSDWDYSVGFLKDVGLDDNHGGKYIGTLIL